MAATVSGPVRTDWGLTIKTANEAFGDRQLTLGRASNTNFASGSGSGALNLAYAEKAAISASGNRTINIQDGSLEDPFGNAVAFFGFGGSDGDAS